jgi:hypothetical protein
MVPKIRMKSIISQKNWTSVLAAVIVRSSSKGVHHYYWLVTMLIRHVSAGKGFSVQNISETDLYFSFVEGEEAFK